MVRTRSYAQGSFEAPELATPADQRLVLYTKRSFGGFTWAKLRHLGFANVGTQLNSARACADVSSGISLRSTRGALTAVQTLTLTKPHRTASLSI
jgi:hypothetical protein